MAMTGVRLREDAFEDIAPILGLLDLEKVRQEMSGATCESETERDWLK